MTTTFQTRRNTTAIDRIRARRRSATRVIIDDRATSALAAIQSAVEAVAKPNGTTQKIGRIARDGLAG